MANCNQVSVDGVVYDIEDSTARTGLNGKASLTHGSTHIPTGSDPIQTASTSQAGLLSANDWNTFYNKQDEIPAGIDGNLVAYSGTAGVLRSVGFDNTPTASSVNLVKSGVVKNALDEKVAISQGSSYVGYYLVVDSNGNVNPSAPYVSGKTLYM